MDDWFDWNIKCTIPKLTGKQNYNFWRIQMETHLRTSNLLQFVQKEIPDNADDESKRKVFLTLSQIHQAIDMSIFGKIYSAKTAKQAWDILERAYRGVNPVQKHNVLRLKGEFELCMMEQFETIENYFSRLLKIKNEMELNGYILNEEFFVDKVLRTLSTKFDHIVAIMLETEDLLALTIEELKHALILYEQRIDGKLVLENKPVEQVLEAQVATIIEERDSSNVESNAQSQNFEERECENYQNHDGSNYSFQQQESYNNSNDYSHSMGTSEILSLNCVENEKVVDKIEAKVDLMKAEEEVIDSAEQKQESNDVAEKNKIDVLIDEKIIDLEEQPKNIDVVVDEEIVEYDSLSFKEKSNFELKCFDALDCNTAIVVLKTQEIEKYDILELEHNVDAMELEFQIYELYENYKERGKYQFEDEWVNMDSFFDNEEVRVGHFAKYNVNCLLYEKLTMKTKYRLVLHLAYTATDFAKEIQARDGVGVAFITSLV